MCDYCLLSRSLCSNPRSISAYEKFIYVSVTLENVVMFSFRFPWGTFCYLPPLNLTLHSSTPSRCIHPYCWAWGGGRQMKARSESMGSHICRSVCCIVDIAHTTIAIRSFTLYGICEHFLTIIVNILIHLKSWCDCKKI